MRKRFIIAAAVLAAIPGTALAMDKVPGGPGGGGHGGGGHGNHGGGSPTSVPEPGTIVLLGGGVVAMGVARRMRRRR
ncbi:MULTISPECIES: PEP-CTERM sorting domain-containing protein [unclassified Sphingosinithalassobacter]|uniref:PEP-CTERM sorting domain-containing protein n=1 Tax=unclassified Sphingosinithalassobacter TaxID=2676235 RepID=UPI00165E9FB8|nr:PEP-CTERM sorting domain-containing protein [Sphingosinithalassobacter sp. CS137]